MFTKAVVLGLAALLSVPAWADDLKRTEIARHDLTGTNMEVVLSVVEIPPGGIAPRHTHHGEEAYYVLEGSPIQSPGKAATELATGTGGINVRDVPHSGWKNIGDKPLKLVTVHVVDKGKPLYDPAE